MFSLSLAVVLAGPVHAQMCSGGNDGGIDATGNECNWPSEVAALITGPATSPPAQVIELGRVLASAKRPAIRLTQVSGQKSTPPAMAAPASKKDRAVSAKTARAEIGSEAFCSGGASGGMDVNGDECGESWPAELSVIAQHQ
ncbi:MAG TPA: hypothetical protein VJ501_14020 [Burkholderiaceae bacterium]|nr:hypothetical protein [Burkholderiaceae bacterium]